jgi:hypothetical protein
MVKPIWFSVLDTDSYRASGPLIGTKLTVFCIIRAILISLHVQSNKYGYDKLFRSTLSRCRLEIKLQSSQCMNHVLCYPDLSPSRIISISLG